VNASHRGVKGMIRERLHVQSVQAYQIISQFLSSLWGSSCIQILSPGTPLHEGKGGEEETTAGTKSLAESYPF
jgi:hypothetical protein